MDMFSRIFPFSMHIVRGHSMQPFLDEGNRVVVFRWAYLLSQPKAGDVVVFSGSDKKKYVKRITAVAADKKSFRVEGDNRNDSRKLPPVKRSAIIGKVVGKY
ncbi:signal peptidase I [Candidatus Curtissbacteria bacterium]|nr:signal peptidase I [Candidatus Curtissbacteria bacterium]